MYGDAIRGGDARASCAVAYITMTDVTDAIGCDEDRVFASCVDGIYPTDIVRHERCSVN